MKPNQLAIDAMCFRYFDCAMALVMLCYFLYPVSCILYPGSMLDHMSLDLGLDLDLDLDLGLNLDFVSSRDGFATPASVWVRSGAQNSSESSVFG